MGKADLPVVARQTLNKAAYDVKKVTMPQTSRQFVRRRPTFFQANSRVEQARGLEINSMRSTVGFVAKSNDRSHSVEDLQQQEHGGGIKNRSLIPMPLARVSSSWKKAVKNEAFMKRILGHLVDAKKSRGSSEQTRFTVAAVFAGVGGFVISEKITNSGGKIVFLITALNRFGGNMAVQCIPVFSVKKDRVVRPKPTHFMESASIHSARKMDTYFNQLAETRLSKA
jgi:hypothetical protein